MEENTLSTNDEDREFILEQTEKYHNRSVLLKDFDIILNEVKSGIEKKQKLSKNSSDKSEKNSKMKKGKPKDSKRKKQKEKPHEIDSLISNIIDNKNRIENENLPNESDKEDKKVVLDDIIDSENNIILQNRNQKSLINESEKSNEQPPIQNQNEHLNNNDNNNDNKNSSAQFLGRKTSNSEGGELMKNLIKKEDISSSVKKSLEKKRNHFSLSIDGDDKDNYLSFQDNAIVIDLSKGRSSLLKGGNQPKEPKAEPSKQPNSDLKESNSNFKESNSNFKEPNSDLKEPNSEPEVNYVVGRLDNIINTIAKDHDLNIEDTLKKDDEQDSNALESKDQKGSSLNQNLKDEDYNSENDPLNQKSDLPLNINLVEDPEMIDENQKGEKHLFISDKENYDEEDEKEEEKNKKEKDDKNEKEILSPKEMSFQKLGSNTDLDNIIYRDETITGYSQPSDFIEFPSVSTQGYIKSKTFPVTSSERKESSSSANQEEKESQNFNNEEQGGEQEGGVQGEEQGGEQRDDNEKGKLCSIDIIPEVTEEDEEYEGLFNDISRSYAGTPKRKRSRISQKVVPRLSTNEKRKRSGSSDIRRGSIEKNEFESVSLPLTTPKIKKKKPDNEILCTPENKEILREIPFNPRLGRIDDNKDLEEDNSVDNINSSSNLPLIRDEIEFQDGSGTRRSQEDSSMQMVKGSPFTSIDHMNQIPKISLESKDSMINPFENNTIETKKEYQQSLFSSSEKDIFKNTYSRTHQRNRAPLLKEINFLSSDSYSSRHGDQNPFVNPMNQMSPLNYSSSKDANEEEERKFKETHRYSRPLKTEPTAHNDVSSPLPSERLLKTERGSSPPQLTPRIKPYNLPLYIEILDKTDTPRYKSISSVLGLQKSNRESTIIDIKDEKSLNQDETLYLNDSLTMSPFEMSTETLQKCNPKNELVHTFTLSDVDGNTAVFKKYNLKSLITRGMKGKVNDVEEVVDIHDQPRKIPKSEIKKLINISHLADIVNSEEDFVDIYDIHGGDYTIMKKDVSSLFSNFLNRDIPVPQKYTFTTKDKGKVELNPYTIRAKKQEEEDEINFTSKSIRNSNLSYNYKNSTSKIMPYILIDEANSYFVISNLKGEKELTKKKKIFDLIKSKNPNYNLDQLKFVVNKNNEKNEYIFLAEYNDYINISEINRILVLLINNKEIPNEITVTSYSKATITLDIKEFLITNYKIRPSPYIKDALITDHSNTYYASTENPSDFTTTSPYKDLQKEQPGLELLEYVKILDVMQIPIFLRKPFVRFLLYNDNYYNTLDVIDVYGNHRVVSLISYISSSSSRVSTLSNHDYNPIPKELVYIDVLEESGRKFHLTQKTKVKLANNMLKTSENIAGINLVDVKKRIFPAKIEKKKIVTNNREWVKCVDIAKNPCYLYISVVKHLLNDGFDKIDATDYYLKKRVVSAVDVKNEISSNLEKRVNSNEKDIVVKMKNS